MHLAQAFQHREDSVMSEDKTIVNAESDTVWLRLAAGKTVTITAGAMKGLVGTVVDHRAHGRILMRIDAGVCVEIDQYCVKAI